jgi:hypothetical protein
MKIGDWSLMLMLATGAVFGACNGESAPPESPPPVSAEPAMPAPAPDAGATAAAATAMPAVEAATSSAATDTPPAPSSPEAATEPPAASGGKGHHGHGSEGEATPSTSAYSGDDPCQTKNFHFSAVSSACKSGGRKAAKNLMRSVVKKAKDAGQSVQCNSCHDDMKSFGLKGNAVGDLKQWL